VPNGNLSTVPVPSEAVLVRRLGEETVFLAPDGRRIHTLNALGTFIWDRIDGHSTLEEIRATTSTKSGPATIWRPS
jgi:hypothetical protein